MNIDDKDGSIFSELQGANPKGEIKKKRKFGQKDESSGVGKKVKVRYPKENACIQYLRDGLWVTATVTKKVHKSKELRWFNVRHMNTDLVDDCVDLGIQEYWRYPEEDYDLGNISSLRSETFDYGAPLVVKGIKSSSPEAFANISSIAGEEEVISSFGEGTPQRGKLLSVSKAVKTPVRLPFRGLALSQGSEKDI